MWQTQFLEFRSIDSLNEISKIITDTHTHELETLQIVKGVDIFVQVSKDPLG